MSEPRFLCDVAMHVPVVQQLTESWYAIRDELRTYTAGPLLTYVDYPKYKIDHSGTWLYDSGWQVIPTTVMDRAELLAQQADSHARQVAATHLMGQDVGDDPDALLGLHQAFVAQTRSHMPVLDAILQAPEAAGLCANGFVSRIQPGTRLQPHRGWSPNWLRVHVGLETDPLATITVGGETRTWTEGGALAFRDGGPHAHSVVHAGTAPRVVLSVDLRLSMLTPYFERVGIDVSDLAPYS
jgi:hypothetical protein